MADYAREIGELSNVQYLDVEPMYDEEAEVLQGILTRNPLLKDVYIGIGRSSNSNDYCMALRAWASTRPIHLVHLHLVGIHLDDETCAMLGKEATSVKYVTIVADISPSAVDALIVSMHDLRFIEIKLTGTAPDYGDFTRFLDGHPMLVEIRRPSSGHPVEVDDAVRAKIRKHGVIKYINYIHSHELIRNQARCSTDYDHDVPLPRSAIALIGDANIPMDYGCSPLPKSWKAYHIASPEDLVHMLYYTRGTNSGPIHVPRAAYDPALDSAFCGFPSQPKNDTVAPVDLRGVSDPDLSPYTGVVVVVDISETLSESDFLIKCERIHRLVGDKPASFLPVRHDVEKLPYELSNARIRKYEEAIPMRAAKHSTHSRRLHFYNVVSAALDLEEYAPYRWFMAAHLLERTDSDGQSMLSASEWSRMLSYCGIDAANGPAVLKIVPRVTSLRVASVDGAVLLLRNDKTIEKFFIPKASYATRALFDMGRDAQRMHRSGKMSAAIVAELYAAALIARDRCRTTYNLPDASLVARLLEAAGFVTHGVHGYACAMKSE